MKQPAFEGSITDVHGIRVGQAQNAAAKTGVTVILASHDGAVVGADVRGAAPGTRETDLCAPENTVERANAVVLAGGSAFGLGRGHGRDGVSGAASGGHGHGRVSRAHRARRGDFRPDRRRRACAPGCVHGYRGVQGRVQGGPAGSVRRGHGRDRGQTGARRHAHAKRRGHGQHRPALRGDGGRHRRGQRLRRRL